MREGRRTGPRVGQRQLQPARLRVGDLVREATLSVLRHPRRSLVTVIGTILGAAVFVASLGLGSTLRQQVSSAFDARRATEVLVEAEDGKPPASWLDDTALSRLRRLNGVVAAGRRITLGDHPMRRGIDTGQPAVAVPILGAEPAAVAVIEPRVRQGRSFDDFHERRAIPVVLLSGSVARQLGINRTGIAVFLDGNAYTVMGIYDDVVRRPEAMAAVIVPYSVAAKLSRATAEAEGPEKAEGSQKRDVLIKTAAGAAQLIGRQAPTALRPEAPTDLRAIAPPDPRTMRRDIEASITDSTALISAVALLIGTVSIGNAATAGIAARTPEIGLRRAVGARRRHIFLQLILETAALGALGGVVGVLLGVLTTAVVSLVNGWVPVIEVRSALGACLASSVAGLLAGLIPAARAVRIPPVQALQR